MCEDGHHPLRAQQIVTPRLIRTRVALYVVLYVQCHYQGGPTTPGVAGIRYKRAGYRLQA